MAEQPPSIKPIAPAGQGKAPVVGGCLLLCTTPAKALSNLITVLEDRPVGKTGVRTRGRASSEPRSARVFLNTSELFFNQKQVSDSWHQLWLQGKLEQRFTQIDTWVAQLKHRWRTSDNTTAKSIIDHENRSTLVEKTAHLAIFTYARSSGRTWSFQFNRRGVEWLLSRVKTNP